MKPLIIGFILVLFSPLAMADDFVPEQEEDVTFSANVLTLDGDDTGGNIQLQFGEALSESLQWDSANARFALSDSLDLQSQELINIRIENLVAAPVCDGSKLGQIYYNTSDKLTYSCDGAGVWNPFENALNSTIEFPLVQARRTTSFPLQVTYTDVDLDTTDLENDVTTLDHDDTLRDRINIGSTGLYQVIYGYTAGGTATATHEARARVRVNDTTILTGSESVNRNYQVEFSTTSASFLANLTAGDFISFQLQRDATVDATQDEIFFSIVKLEGIKGDPGAQGPAGPAGADGADGINGADGDITWEGAWGAQNYTVNQAVEFNGSSYVCIQNTVSNEDPTNPTYWELLAAKGADGVSGAGGGTDAETFILDQDDTGGNVVLQFGASLSEFLTWDNTNNRFSLSDDIAIGGAVFVEGNLLTLDADNLVAGTNVSIVAEQGSDNNGEIRYNAATNQWELSNNGGLFAAVSTNLAPSVFYAYDGVGGQTVDGTERTVNLDTSVIADSNYSLVADEVTVAEAGLYRISAEVGLNGDDTGGAQRSSVDIRVQENGVNIPGAFSKCYLRESEENACSLQILDSIAAGATIRVRQIRNGATANITLLPDASRLIIERIR